jgi:hypothetical protein
MTRRNDYRPGREWEKICTMRNTVFALLACAAGLLACRDPKNTELPRELKNIKSLDPAMQKLTGEERQLAAAYIVRHMIGAIENQEGPGIPEGMTLGRAIEEQRKFAADRAKLQTERDAALKSMREAVTVTLVSKEKIVTKRGKFELVLDEDLRVTFGYKNNTARDISGVKGYVSVEDLFGDELSGFQISNDTTIKAGETATWVVGRSIRFAMGNNNDHKLSNLSDDKFKVVWKPQVILFSDGSKLSLPAD